MSITIGTDPEIFLRDSKSKAPVPVVGLIGGSKGDPIDLKDGYGVQEDNVMLEFNTPPTPDPYQFANSITVGLQRSLELVHKANKGLEYDERNEILFGFDLLQDKQARMFGCSPEFDAYNGGAVVSTVDPKQLDEEEGSWRFAGGHVHLGYTPATADLPPFVAASFADVFLGLAACGLDTQAQRRQYYGQPGRYRPTPYGIEYRTLSNFWITDLSYAEQIAQKAVSLGYFLETWKESRMQELFKAVPWTDVKQAIVEEDADRAADVLAFLRYDMKVGELT